MPYDRQDEKPSRHRDIDTDSRFVSSLAVMKLTFKTVKQESFTLDIEENTKVSDMQQSYHEYRALEKPLSDLQSAQIADVKALVEAEKGEAYPVASQLIISQGKVDDLPTVYVVHGV